MTWDDYKKEVKEKDIEAKKILDEAEAKSKIITAMINRRKELGLSQRDLANLCEIPQSSVARIEANQTVPKLDTLLKIFARLDLVFTVVPTQSSFSGMKKSRAKEKHFG